MHDVKFYCLTFIERFVSFHLDRREMNEYVPAFFCLNKAVTFLCIEPFDFTLHPLNIPFIVLMV